MIYSQIKTIHDGFDMVFIKLESKAMIQLFKTAYLYLIKPYISVV
jgi:hypothetical protein